MELDVKGLGLEYLEKDPSAYGFEEGDLDVRSKTSLRMHYEAQVKVIQKQTGNLDEIRGNLGLSQRKMAQLLMVDPSSWTRWTKQGDEAPPHIWRALQWYMALREKIPGLTPQYFIGSNPGVLHQKALQEVESERKERKEEIENLAKKLRDLDQERAQFQSEIQSLKKDLNFHRKISIVILLTSTLSAALLFVWKGL